MTGKDFGRQVINELHRDPKENKSTTIIKLDTNMSNKHPTAGAEADPAPEPPGGLYLVLAEGSLDEAGGLIQLSLLRVG